MTWEIIKADERHRAEVNRLIVETQIGGSLSKREFGRKSFWVARVSGKIVACAGLDFYGSAAILTALAVEKHLRHKGIGSALINTRMDAARIKGVKIAALVTMYYWFNFYKRRGFRTCPRKDLPDLIKNYPMFTAQRYKKCAVMYQNL